MKKLIIVESPAKIKTISKFLGKEFVIMSTMGHIKDLPTKEVGITINDDEITLQYVPLEGKSKVIADICKQARNADAIFLASDPDREGEIIAWHIGNEIEKVNKNDVIKRISFNEITKPAILEALAHPGEIDLKKVSAQQARRILDRWVGYEVSPILWKKLAPGLSAGRVQSVALRLICEREEAIRAFKVEEYWTIDGTFGSTKQAFIASLALIKKEKPVITTEKEAKALETAIKKESYTIDSIVDKKRTRNPLAPFMTSSLQQEAYNKLGFAVKKTMQLAQQLYEGVPLDDPKNPIALITYMRTDSLRISDTAIKQARDHIKKQYSAEYLPSAPVSFEKKKKAKAQDAHEAVRPIDISITPEKVNRYISGDLAKLYDLIWRRFIACQMSPAIYAQRQVTIIGGDFTFKATGSTLLFDGFLTVYQAEDEEKEQKLILPDNLKEQSPTNLSKVESKQHFTQPPARYNEATLVKEMEKEGIGRPATYATILNTIRARAYTTLEKKRFVPTELGMTVTKLLVENLPKIMDVAFTAHMEEDLDKIASGEIDRDKLLKKFYKTFQQDLSKFTGSLGRGKAIQPTEIQCPECKKNVLGIRFGKKSGEFLGCMGYPDCKFTSNFTRDEAGVIQLVAPEKPKLLDETCPQCGSQMRELNGRYGPFIACSNYPQCKYIKPTMAPFSCPLCKGNVAQKAWRGGKFWGCVNYPKCQFSVFGAIQNTPCSSCKWPFMAVDKEGKLSCANKECPSKKG